MPNRAKDWLAQAQQDLTTADVNARNDRHEWACFVAQQAAEKAVKAVHQWHGQEARGHDVAGLLRDLPSPPPAPLVEKAMVLDTFYIPTRYPNGHPEGAPYQHFGSLQSEQARGYAREIVEFARAEMAKPRDG